MDERKSLRCSIIRGGTSKGIFIKENELPDDSAARDAVIRAVFGSPDIRQIDGLGGADVLTSKLAIIGPPSRPDADVDYTFGQVSFETDKIDYSGNCGNISSAVGPYAIDEGMVRADGEAAFVRIHMKNTGRILRAEVPTRDGRAVETGDFAIDGVPGTGARIMLDWSDTAGGVTGKLLPTGNVKDQVCIEGKNYEVSLVDAGNPLVFIRAEALGMTGTESPDEIENNAELMRTIEKIRGWAAARIGLCERPEEAARVTPYNPFFAIVSKPQSYRAINGKEIREQEIDLTARLLFMLRMHKAYPITGTAATAAAVRIPGSVAWEVLREEAKNRETICIGHPSGKLPAESIVSVEDGRIQLKKIGVYRTARRIMDGRVYLPEGIDIGKG